MGAIFLLTFTFRLPTSGFQITGLETRSTGIHLAWEAAPDQSYSVLASSNLLDWTRTSVGVAGEFIDTQTAGFSPKFYRVVENINPNPLISLGKPTAGATAAQYQSSSTMVDGVFGTFATRWVGGYPTPAAPAWVSIKLGQGPTRVLLEFNCGFNYNYRETEYGGPLDYAIYTSPDSTDGANGSWVLAVSVTNNVYRTRASSFDFSGMQWVRLSCTAAPANSQTPGVIYDPGIVFDEIEAYDISAAHSRGRIAEDTWFFMGDSITAFWANRATATGTNDPASHMPDFAQCVHGDHLSYFPSMIDGGIGGESSADGLARLPADLAANPDYTYWALGYGSNDAAGNNADTTAFRNNLQAMITLLRTNGRWPVLPQIPYAADGQHNFITNFNAVIDHLIATNHILAGPDLYTFFKAHPDQLADGLHPNDAGMRSFNLLWSLAVRHLYP